MTSIPADRQARKGLGAFYSPPTLVEPMIGWAVAGPSHCLLDPSCGDGIFLESAARRLLGLGASPDAVARLLHGCDVNPEAARRTEKAVRPWVGRRKVDVRTVSFFTLEPPGARFGECAVDAIVGNPPYIRYQQFSGSSRSLALSRVSAAGVKLTQLASSWAHFVVHAIAFLKRGGRLALILPAEIIHATYAAPLRRYLRESFADVFVISFRSTVFAGAQEEVVVLLARGRGEAHRGLGLIEADCAGDLHHLDHLLEKSELFARGMEPTKWIPGYTTNPGAASLDHLRKSGLYLELGRIGKVSIGFVSGANEFFVLSPAEAASRGLPEHSLRPAVIRARQIPGLVVTPESVVAMRRENQRCLLWLPGSALARAEQAYIEEGERNGIAGRYKCRVRSPWWVVPGVLVPEAFLTYMSDTVPRLCLNDAAATAANTLLTVKLTGVPEALRKASVIAFYNSATLLSCERIGRSYGGGVLKLEPSEADRILVPSTAVVKARKCELLSLSSEIHEGLAGDRSRLEQAIGRIDSIVLEGYGMGKTEIHELALARAASVDRRKARAKRPRHPLARDGIETPSTANDTQHELSTGGS